MVVLVKHPSQMEDLYNALGIVIEHSHPTISAEIVHNEQRINIQRRANF